MDLLSLSPYLLIADPSRSLGARPGDDDGSDGSDAREERAALLVVSGVIWDFVRALPQQLRRDKKLPKLSGKWEWSS